jgi:putative heme transporter
VVGAVLAVAVELRTGTGRERLRRLTAFSIRVSQRVTRRPKGSAEAHAQSVLSSVMRVRLGALAMARAPLWGMVNWWADVTCLAFAMRAAGITGLSLGRILIVWTAGVSAASLSPTPGGIGVVEVAMVAALAAVGIKAPRPSRRYWSTG